MRKVARAMMAGGIAVAATIALVGCGPSSNGGTGSNGDNSNSGGEAGVCSGTYEMGALFPLSGSAAALGQDFLTFAEYGVEAANEAYADAGFQISLKAEDSLGTTEGGVSGINRLAGVGDAVFVIMAWSSVVQAAATLAAELDVTIVNSGAGDSFLVDASPNLVSLMPLNVQKNGAGAYYLASEKGAKRGAVIYVDNASGHSAEDDFSTAFGAAGGEVVEVQSIKPDAVDAAPQVAKIAAANPDTIYVMTLASEGASALNAIRDANLDVHLIVDTGVGQAESVRTSTGEVLKGALYSQSRSVGIDDPTMAGLVERYRSENGGNDPSVLSYMPYQYDSAFVLAETIKNLCDAGEEVTGKSVTDFLRSGHTFEVPLLGEVSFDERGLVNFPIEIYEIADSSDPIASDEVVETIVPSW